MKNYLIFPTKEAAIIADLQVAINFNMGLEPGDTTTQYQEIMQQRDGTWYFKTPPDVIIYMPPEYTPRLNYIDGNDDDQQAGDWSYPTLTKDSLINVVGYLTSNTVEPMPILLMENNNG